MFAEVRSFHRALDPQATPLIDAPSIARSVGASRVLLKWERERFGVPAFKALGTFWAADQVMRSAPRPVSSLVAASDGNHGVALAAYAHRNRVRADIFLPLGVATDQRERLRTAGAGIHEVDGAYEDAVAAAVTYAELAPGRQLVQDITVTGHEAPARWCIEGYTTIWTELEEQGIEMDDHVDLVIPCGGGALAASAVLATAARPTRPRVVTVETDTAPSLQASLRAGRPIVVVGPHRTAMIGLACGTVSAAAWSLLADGVHHAVHVSDPEAEDAIVELHHLGVETSATGASALAGLRAAASGIGVRGRTVIVLVTEGVTDVAHVQSVLARARER